MHQNSNFCWQPESLIIAERTSNWNWQLAYFSSPSSWSSFQTDHGRMPSKSLWDSIPFDHDQLRGLSFKPHGKETSWSAICSFQQTGNSANQEWFHNSPRKNTKARRCHFVILFRIFRWWVTFWVTLYLLPSCESNIKGFNYWSQVQGNVLFLNGGETCFKVCKYCAIICWNKLTKPTLNHSTSKGSFGALLLKIIEFFISSESELCDLVLEVIEECHGTNGKFFFKRRQASLLMIIYET